ncbi:CaiB/BaiF CoA transferase family protein [Neobacillus citreus]|uniref:CoA transferase n=1 Tax=Neobacillus citreus TaxID=2833578 RepID=A0A942T5R0_9BACI|nr:CoA transferase [Neobacillus citreus]MCH6264342.1 CoA transferase [Neobacillus citreus]
MMKPLEGCLVLDLTRVLAGPYCTMILGDLGARVIKIEVPGTGDDSRGYGPFQNGESAYFMSINRNKQSMTLNLKTEEGRKIFEKLVKQADVLVENFRPGTMEKLGYPFEVLKEINRKLVYTTVSGFGHTGPFSQKPAYDIIVQALGGMMSITGEEGGTPMKAGASIGDITAGLFAAIGTLGALSSVSKGSDGQHVDISMLDSQVAILENAISRYFVGGEVPSPIGNRHPSITPFCSFPTSNGFIIVAIGNDSMWKKFCKLLNFEKVSYDSRFLTNADRTNNWKELQRIFESEFLQKTTEDWLIILEEAGIPSGPIQTINQVVNHPQVINRNMIIEVEHPEAGVVKMAGNPIKFSDTAGQDVTHSPLLGQHTEVILKELGYIDDEILAYRKKQII